jgi:CRISPR-associated protein Csm1
MSISPLLEQSSRIALAAFLHDLGKFAERAKIKIDQTTLDDNKQLYCPHRKTHVDGKGWFSHVHAAYTGVAMDILEPHLPNLKGVDFAPFGSWKTRDADDSFINAAAKHHKPENFLQWVIATADRVASGFDREEFERYNHAEEGTETGKNHYTARQVTLFEQINRGDRNKTDSKKSYDYRYPLKPLSPKNIFPELAKDCEGNSDKEAQEEYLKLWKDFNESLKKIPEAHRDNWPLWLDHFETLWGVYTQAIPSATAFNTRPDVSLYDHSRVTAALATALWRYHHENSSTTIEAVNHWEERKFLLIQGDFFGIQNFIFASGDSHKRAAKLLRGRSFYVSLLTECAALKVLDALNLPSTSQVINAAGKFQIVAPNTDDTRQTLQTVRQELNAWFLKHSYGQAGIGLAWTEAACNDFCRKASEGGKSPYRALLDRLFAELEQAKLQRFDLCGKDAPVPVFEDYLDSFDNTLGVCKIDGRSPAVEKDEDDAIGALARDQIEIGHCLANRQRLLVTRNSLNTGNGGLRLDVFGYRIAFVESEDIRGKFGAEAKSGNLLRAWDFALPAAGDQPLWNGYARRHINAFVPRFDDTALTELELDKYQGVDEAVTWGEAKTLNHLACEDRRLNENHRWQGTAALTTLKGDVDNLGALFQNGLGDEASFSKTAALSRQLNNFFAVYLPWLCQKEFPNSYTVFAGGDDFFLIGPWWSQIRLAQKMREDFARYVAGNETIHFSAGLSATKPGLPIPYLSDLAEEALEKAKANTQSRPKNAVTCFGQTVPWDTFDELVGARLNRLSELSQDNALSTGYVYGLLHLIDMAEKVKIRPENAIWHSYFVYRTVRMLEKSRLDKDQRNRRRAELAQEIAQTGIEVHKGDYRVTLFCYLYQQRF